MRELVSFFVVSFASAFIAAVWSEAGHFDLHAENSWLPPEPKTPLRNATRMEMVAFKRDGFAILPQVIPASTVHEIETSYGDCFKKALPQWARRDTVMNRYSFYGALRCDSLRAAFLSS